MRRLAAGALALGLGAATTAAQEPRWVAESASTTVEARLLPSVLTGPVVVVEGELGGVTAWFLIDTGAQQSIIDVELAERLELKLHRGQPTETPTGSSRGQVGQFPELRVGGAVAPAQPLAVDRVRRLFGGGGQDVGGLLGTPFLRGMPFTIDYAASRVTLHDPDRFEPPQGATAVRLYAARSRPSIKVRVGDHTMRALVDTGAQVSLLVGRRNSPKLLPDDVEHFPTVTMGWMGGVEDLRAAVASVDIDPAAADGLICPDTLLYLRVAEDGEEPRGWMDHPVLGGGLLQRFSPTFDLQGKRLYLAPRVEKIPADMPSFGFTVGSERFAPDVVLVTTVLDGSPAAAAGLETGDKLLRLDDVPVVGLTEVANRLRRGGELTVQLMRPAKKNKRSTIWESEPRALALRAADFVPRIE